MLQRNLKIKVVRVPVRYSDRKSRVNSNNFVLTDEKPYLKQDTQRSRVQWGSEKQTSE